MTRPVPPVARKQPLRIEQLGRVRVDDYAWMKDDNWQAVLRDPGAIKADVKAHLEAENAYAAAMLAATEPLQAATVRGDEGADQGGRRLGPQPGRAVRLLQSATRRAPSTRSTRAGRAAARTARRCCWTRTPRPRARPTSRSPPPTTPRPRPVRLCRRRAGLGSLPHPDQGPGHRRDPARTGGEQHRRLLLVAGFAWSVLDLARRQRPPGQGVPPPGARRRRRTTCWSTRSRTSGLFLSASASPPRTRASSSARATTRPAEVLADPGRRPHRRAQGGRAAHAWAALRPGALGRALRHPHQRRRRRWTSRSSPRRRDGARPRPVARLGGAPARPLHRRRRRRSRTGWCGWCARTPPTASC